MYDTSSKKGNSACHIQLEFLHLQTVWTWVQVDTVCRDLPWCVCIDFVLAGGAWRRSMRSWTRPSETPWMNNSSWMKRRNMVHRSFHQCWMLCAWRSICSASYSGLNYHGFFWQIGKNKKQITRHSSRAFGTSLKTRDHHLTPCAGSRFVIYLGWSVRTYAGVLAEPCCNSSWICAETEPAEHNCRPIRWVAQGAFHLAE